MVFKKQFKEAHPETIGETDNHYDKSNYIDWIDKEYAQLQADKTELLEQIEIYKEFFELYIDPKFWDEATEFLSTAKNGLAKELLKKKI